MKTALLIVDVQNDYFPNGKMELFRSMDASIKIKELMKSFRERSMPVVHVKHIATRPGATFFLPNTPGAEIHENVKPLNDEKIIIKNYPNSFRNTELDAYLKENNISKLVITGMMTHMCIDSTVRAAFDLGYECMVVADCCATKTLKIDNDQIMAENVQNAFLAALNGTFSKVVKKEDVAELIE